MIGLVVLVVLVAGCTSGEGGTAGGSSAGASPGAAIQDLDPTGNLS